MQPRKIGQRGRVNTRVTALPSYPSEIQKWTEFLSNFTSGEEGDKYAKTIREIRRRRAKEIVVELDDLQNYADLMVEGEKAPEWHQFICNVERNCLRYVKLLQEAIDGLLDALPLPQVGSEVSTRDVEAIVRDHQLRGVRIPGTNMVRTDVGRENLSSGPQDGAQALPAALPKSLTRNYEARILGSHETKIIPLRKVGARHIGSLVRIRGMVTRTTEVKPLMIVAAYTCSDCETAIYQEVLGKTFMPIIQCPSAECQKKQTKGRLHPHMRASKFTKFQEVRIQEIAEEVPMGHVPTSLIVHARGEASRKCGPGDIVTLWGIFLPTPSSGFKAMQPGALLSETFMDAMAIQRHKKSYLEYSITPMMEREIMALAESPRAYATLASSLAPEIFGHDDVKKALLLLMVGGVTKDMGAGMRIRGDINICLMGDPGVAKSQLLKHISRVAPRAIYTSGKGSSGVGLTAAVIKDPISGELVLEGGALVLADMGVCCIDEFDKMDDSDRTAIHEVMEQQTVSIAKAGITTRLNARTSILAAANPAFGRYNPHRSPEENINLPAALLSRFDLLFLVLDRPSRSADLELARHVCHVHRHGKHPGAGRDGIKTPEFMRAYISLARKVDPAVPDHLISYITDAYVNMRSSGGMSGSSASAGYTYTTARTLLGILRLGQALARIRFSDEISQADVDEAMRLMHSSKASLYEPTQGRTNAIDPVSAIYSLVRDWASGHKTLMVKEEEILPQVLARGFTLDQMRECIQEYEMINIWTYSTTSREIRFMSYA